MIINTISDLLTYIYSITLDNNKLRFRGQANRNWKIIPSIYRFSGFKRYQTVFFEDFLLKSKPSKPIPPLMYTTFDLEWLMLCQHYGIPTRLIDWSFDILTALFFACYNDDEKYNDGSITICNLSDYSIFSNYNDTISNNKSLAFINTNIVNPRMHNQFGCFMMWGHPPLRKDTTETYSLEEYQANSGNSYYHDEVIIPSSSKDFLLEELKRVYSITFDNIFVKNGYIDSNYERQFINLKENAKLYTLFITESSRLTAKEREIAKSNFGSIENMCGNCTSVEGIGI